MFFTSTKFFVILTIYLDIDSGVNKYFPGFNHVSNDIAGSPTRTEDAILF